MVLSADTTCGTPCDEFTMTSGCWILSELFAHEHEPSDHTDPFPKGEFIPDHIIDIFTKFGLAPKRTARIITWDQSSGSPTNDV